MSRKIILLKLFRNMFGNCRSHSRSILLHVYCVSLALHIDYFRIYTGYVLSFLHTI